MGITLIFKVSFLAKKSMTVKLEKEMLEDIDNECEGLGCNRTDFVIQAVQEKLDENTQDLKINYEDLKEDEPVGKGVIKKVSYDGGKTWFNVKPILELTNVTVEN